MLLAGDFLEDRDFGAAGQQRPIFPPKAFM